jgi:copper chaperone
MATATYRIDGMTCGHCTNAVQNELAAIDGVAGVVVGLEPGTATVTSDAPIDDAVIEAAVTAAGYAIVTQ